jgi:hypothetical protein
MLLVNSYELRPSIDSFPGALPGNPLLEGYCLCGKFWKALPPRLAFPPSRWEREKRENYEISPLNNQQLQKKPRGEKKVMNTGEKKGTFRGLDRDEIRQIQMLMFLCLCLSPQSKLRQLLEMALAIPETETIAHAQATPCDDVSVDGLFNWLNSVFGQTDMTESEKRLLEWQNDQTNMVPAINELKTIESKLGFKISIEKLNSQ